MEQKYLLLEKNNEKNPNIIVLKVVHKTQINNKKL